MSWAVVAIVFGILILVTRAPLLIRPDETLASFDRLINTVLGTDARVRVLGVVYIVIAAACLTLSDSAPSGLRLAIRIIGAACVGAAVWTLLAPETFRAFFDRMLSGLATRPGIVRGLGALAVAIGALFIVLGVRAL